MGQLLQRTYRGTDGKVKTCRTWTIRYYRNGRPYEESTKYKRKGDAQHLLKLREGDIAKGMPVSPQQFKTTFDDAAKTVIDDYTANGKRSLVVAQLRIDKHLMPYFGGRRLADISSDQVLAYITHRQQQGIVNKAGQRIGDVSNAAINRELQILKRCFSLAVKHGKLFVCAHLPAAIVPVIRFAFITGWRIPSEVLTLQWRHVDFAAGVVRLDPGMAKNGEARTFKLTAELRTVLTAQQAEQERLTAAGTLCPWLFFRLVSTRRRGPKQPKRIGIFRKVWHRACARAGLPGRIPHDLRRSAVRAFVRAGIGEHVAMQMSGHKTPSVFRRYNIVSEADLSDAAAKLDAADRDSSVTVGHERAVGRAANT